jgi:hypothetical protein
MDIFEFRDLVITECRADELGEPSVAPARSHPVGAPAWPGKRTQRLDVLARAGHQAQQHVAPVVG